MKHKIITPKIMKKYRKQSIVMILFISAIITPPDIISQLLIGIPLIIMYEISIIAFKTMKN
jgi:sec-independent protein translocase protein TatC